MPNVLDGINQMNKDQLSYQLATLEMANMTNAFSEFGQKASNKTVKIFNGFRRMANASEVKEPEIISLGERIAALKIYLDNNKSTEQLLEETRKILKEKLKSTGVTFEGRPSDDALSVAIIDAGCKCFKNQISDGLTPAQKADAIYQRYNERLISQTQKEYAKATDEQKKKIDEMMKQEFDSIPDECKEELRKALGVEKLTSDMLVKFISTSAGASALLLALNASGFGAYMALTTIIHAIFTTVFGITLPFTFYTSATTALSFALGPGGFILLAGVGAFMLNRQKNNVIYELLAQVVWSSVLQLGGKFTPKEESLPSWLPEEQRVSAISDNKEYLTLCREYEKLKNRFDSQAEEIRKKDEEQQNKEQEITSLNKRINRQKNLISEIESQKKTAENDLSIAKSEYEKYKEYADSENEALKAQCMEAERKVASAKEAINSSEQKIINIQKFNLDSQKTIQFYENELAKVTEEKSKLQSENEQMKDKVEALEAVYEHATEKNAGKLEERWKTTYKKFEFDPKTIKYVVKHYQYNEYGEIESKLMELHQAKDPAAITSNRGKLKGQSNDYHLEFTTRDGASRICYRVLKNEPNGKTIAITDVYRHNEKKYS